MIVQLDANQLSKYTRSIKQRDEWEVSLEAHTSVGMLRMPRESPKGQPTHLYRKPPKLAIERTPESSAYQIDSTRESGTRMD
jgi:hypothetical protein